MHDVIAPQLILACIGLYFGLLIAIAYFTSKDGGSNSDFFLAGRNSNWVLISIGMIGASLSGVTFVSIPGTVGNPVGIANSQFSYMQIVLGYFAGYLFIAKVLLPLYYKLNLTTIYQYLNQRFGVYSYRSGAALFVISRVLGAAIRLFLTTYVLHEFVFKSFGVSPIVTSIISVLLIWVYTFKGGTKTIIITDVSQTIFMILSLVLSIGFICSYLNLGIFNILPAIQKADLGKVFFFDQGWENPNNFFKQFLGGAFTTIAMTGLDQDMMQKNLTCKNLKEAQKNMYWFSSVLVFVNMLFLILGALLYMYHYHKYGVISPGITPDSLFPYTAFNEFPPIFSIIFIIGLIATAYSSADSAMAALTTSICVDFLDMKEKNDSPEQDLRDKKMRQLVHIGFSVIFVFVLIFFFSFNEKSVINLILRLAGYTYGPLLGLFLFGVYTNLKPADKYVPFICIASPIICYILAELKPAGYTFGFELGLINALITSLMLYLVSNKKERYVEEKESKWPV